MTTDSHSIVHGWDDELNALPLSPADSFRAMLERTVAALNSLLLGDPDPFNGLWSRADYVAVVGGFGGYERGWERVRQNTESAASRFKDGRLLGIELVTLGASASGTWPSASGSSVPRYAWPGATRPLRSLSG